MSSPYCVARSLLPRRAAAVATPLRLPTTSLASARWQSTMTAADVAQALERTAAGQVTSRRQLLDGNQAHKLALTLGRRGLHPTPSSAGAAGADTTTTTPFASEEAPAPGTPLPPGYHLVYFTPAGTEAELGADGTDRAFNAAAPFTRRMWAGGRMRWVPGAGLRVGEQVEERTRMLSAVPKRSRDGAEMVLVEVEKEFWGERGLALVDQRSWIFRKELPLPAEGEDKFVQAKVVQGPSESRDVESADGGFATRHLRWSPVGLFRFSALTFNGHKIHYDEAWTQGIESHPGCVVHGPLNLISILDYWRDVCGRAAAPAEIAYRAMSPLYAGDEYHISAAGEPGPDGGREVLVQKGGRVCVKASIKEAT